MELMTRIIAIIILSACTLPNHLVNRNEQVEEMPFVMSLTNQVSLSWDKINSYISKNQEYDSKYDLTYLKNYKKECLEQKKENSCLKIISLYSKGMRQNEAFGYAQITCNLNNGLGCLIAGMIELRRMKYNSGRYFFEKSCRLQDGNGCYILGRRFKKIEEKKK